MTSNAPLWVRIRDRATTIQVGFAVDRVVIRPFLHQAEAAVACYIRGGATAWPDVKGAATVFASAEPAGAAEGLRVALGRSAGAPAPIIARAVQWAAIYSQSRLPGAVDVGRFVVQVTAACPDSYFPVDEGWGSWIDTTVREWQHSPEAIRLLDVVGRALG